MKTDYKLEPNPGQGIRPVRFPIINHDEAVKAGHAIELQLKPFCIFRLVKLVVEHSTIPLKHWKVSKFNIGTRMVLVVIDGYTRKVVRDGTGFTLADLDLNSSINFPTQDLFTESKIEIENTSAVDGRLDMHAEGLGAFSSIGDIELQSQD